MGYPGAGDQAKPLIPQGFLPIYQTQGKGAESSLKLKTPELFLGARADHRVATIKARAINLPLGFGDIGNNFRRYAAALCGRRVQLCIKPITALRLSAYAFAYPALTGPNDSFGPFS